MANREVAWYPVPNAGDIEVLAGAVLTTVIGLQTTPVSATAPTAGQALVAVDDGTGTITWTPESAGGWVKINSIPVSDDYLFSFNTPIAATSQSPGVTVNGV